jgi:prophage regulatory protein
MHTFIIGSMQGDEIAPNTPTRLLAKPHVLERTTWSDTTLWRRVRAGDFPRPIRISPGRVAWRESDVEAWIKARAESAR